MSQEPINFSQDHLRAAIIKALSSLRNKSYRRAKLPDFVRKFIKNEWRGSKRKMLSEALMEEMRSLVAENVLQVYQAKKDSMPRIRLTSSSAAYLVNLQQHLEDSRDLK